MTTTYLVSYHFQKGRTNGFGSIYMNTNERLTKNNCLSFVEYIKKDAGLDEVSLLNIVKLEDKN